MISVAAGILKNEASQYLLVHCPKIEGLYEFPGGKLEPHESPDRALERELFEELGIQIDLSKTTSFTFCYDYDKKILILYYFVTTWEGNIILRENQENFIWCSKDTDIPSLRSHDEYVFKQLSFA